MSVFHKSVAKRKLLSAARQARTSLPANIPPVFWMTDPTRTPDIASVCQALPRGWGVILRHFGQDDQIDNAARIAQICRGRGLVFLVANDANLAKKIGADGVHWPFANRAKAKYWRGAFRLMTISAHSAREIRQLDPHAFNAAIVSCVFTSQSPTAANPIGTLAFRAIARGAPLPCYGLGGVNARNAQSLTPTAGLAMVSSIDVVFGT